MPIYEYQCQACNHVHEIFQRISEEPLTTCPDCQGPLKKMISVSAFHLKGGGWYSDGYTSCGSGCSGDSGNGGGNGSSGTSKNETPAPSQSTSTTDKSTCAKSGNCCATHD